MPGSAQSAAYAVAAATLSRASWRATGRPTTRRPSRVATASAMTMLPARVGLDGVDDLRVAGAAAEVAFERGADGVAVGARLALQEGERGQEHSGRAEAALHGAVAHERVLQRVQAAVALEAPQRHHRAAAQAGGQHQARRHRPAVEQHRADAAHALVAAFLDVEDAERLAQQLEQRLVGAHVDLARPAVEDEPRDHRRARSTARPSARRPSTPATWRRYAPDTNASEGGASASRATWAARASASAVGSRPRSASSAARACTGRSATPPKARRASSTRPRRSRLTSATTATIAKSPARRESSSTAQPYAGTAAISTPVTISPGVSAVVSGPVKNSRAARVRRPDAEATASRASSAVMTAGSSAAGSACARLPPTVPSVRTRTLPISRAASATTGHRRAIASDSSNW